MRFGMVFAAVLALSGLAGQVQADDVYITVEGAKQGKFKGSGEGLHGDKNSVVKMEWGMSSALPATAKVGTPILAIARRSHQPLTLTLRLSPFTPQLFQAAATNENLKSVLYEVYQTTPEGDKEVTNTIRLSNARVSSIRFVDKNGLDDGVNHLVEVSLVYQKIEIENKPGKVMASDDATMP